MVEYEIVHPLESYSVCAGLLPVRDVPFAQYTPIFVAHGP
jgi:hypothetical protein